MDIRSESSRAGRWHDRVHGTGTSNFGSNAIYARRLTEIQEVHDCWRPENEKHVDDHQEYHTVTIKSDVWSVGLVIMTMMNRDTDDESMPAYRCDISEPNFAGKLGETYPLPLQRLVLECLKHNPEERPTPSRLWETIQSATGNLKFMPPSWEECDFANPKGNMYAGFAAGWQ